MFAQDEHRNTFSLLQKQLAKKAMIPRKMVNKNAPAYAGFAVSVKKLRGRELGSSCPLGLKCGLLLLFARQSLLVKSPGIRINVSRGLEGRRGNRGRRTQTGAVRGSPYRRCDGLCVCVSLRCIARQDSAIRRCQLVRQ